MPEYFSFEDVLKELNIDEEELKRMVSEGELRAFRSENKMKFKAEDVDNLKKGRVTEPTVILPSTPTPPKGTPAVEEGVLDLDIGDEVTKIQKGLEEEKPTEELVKPGKPESKPVKPAQPTAADEPLVFDETDLTVEEVAAEAKAEPGEAKQSPDETYAEEETAGVSTETEPLKFADEPEVATEEVTEEAPVAEGEVVEAAPVARRAPRRRGMAAQIPQVVQEQIERRRAHWAWSVLMFLTLIGTVAYTVVIYDTFRFTTGSVDRPSKMTEGSTEWILNKFYGDPEWSKKFIDAKCFPQVAADNPVPPPAHWEMYKSVTFKLPDAPRPVTPEPGATNQ